MARTFILKGCNENLFYKLKILTFRINELKIPWRNYQQLHFTLTAVFQDEMSQDPIMNLKTSTERRGLSLFIDPYHDMTHCSDHISSL